MVGWSKSHPESTSFRLLDSAGDIRVMSNVLSGNSTSIFTGYTFLNNHTSQVRLVNGSIGGAFNIGVGVRMSTSAETYYAYVGNNTSSKLIKIIDGVETVLAIGSAFGIGYNYRLSVSGNTLMCYRDNAGGLTFTLDTSINGNGIYVDNTNPITSGNPGLAGYGNSANLRLDNYLAYGLIYMNNLNTTTLQPTTTIASTTTLQPTTTIASTTTLSNTTTYSSTGIGYVGGVSEVTYPAPLRTIYINSGTSIQTAFTNVQAGDEYVLRPGVHTVNLSINFSADNSPEHPVIIRGEEGSVITMLNESTAMWCLRIYGDFYVFDNLTFDHSILRDAQNNIIYSTNKASMDVRGTGIKIINSEFRNCTRDLLTINGAQNILVDTCLFHHAMRKDGVGLGNYVDCHGIVAYDEQNLTINNCRFWHLSGDGFQTDPGYNDVAWNFVTVTNCLFESYPLEANWHTSVVGERTGENAIDFKTSYAQYGHPRAQVYLENIEARGYIFDRLPMATRSYIDHACYNIKQNINVTMINVVAHDCEYGFRLRGSSTWLGNDLASSHITMINCSAYDCDIPLWFEQYDPEYILIQDCQIEIGRGCDMILSDGYHLDTPRYPMYFEERTFLHDGHVNDLSGIKMERCIFTDNINNLTNGDIYVPLIEFGQFSLNYFNSTLTQIPFETTTQSSTTTLASTTTQPINNILVDHTTFRLDDIPLSAVTNAQNNLKIAYWHRSHGGQLTAGGMAAIRRYSSEYNTTYAYTNSRVGTGLFIDEMAQDLSGFESTWYQTTRQYLLDPDNDDINVVMWAWSDVCAAGGTALEVLNNTMTRVTNYLNNMQLLENEFGYGGTANRTTPITLVYTTANATARWPDWTATETKNLACWSANTRIRKYCIDNNKVLFDHYDLECWNPDGVYYGDGVDINPHTQYAGLRRLYEDNSYSTQPQTGYRQNHGLQWMAANPNHEYTLMADDNICTICEHSDGVLVGRQDSRLQCIIKGMAAWHLWTKLGGWISSGNTETTTQAITTTLAPTTTQAITTTLTPTTTNDINSVSINFDTYTPNAQLHTMTGWAKTNPGTTAFRLLDSAGDLAVQPQLTADNVSCVYTGLTFSNNQYSQFRVTNISVGAGYYIGVAVRMSTSNETYYAYVGNNSDSKLIKVVNGVETVLGTSSAFIYGYNYKLIVINNTLFCYRDGNNNLIFSLETNMADEGSYEDLDNPITSGNTGIAGYGSTSSLRLNNWVTGEI